MKEHSSHDHAAHKKDTIEIPIGKLKKNPWIISTILLAIVLVVVLVMYNKGGGMVSADNAGESVVSFINNNPNLNSQVSLVKTEKEGQLYKVTLNYEGQEVPLYTTLDGKYLVSNIVPLSGDAAPADDGTLPTDTAPSEVPKSDKPVVELFIMSYCPYGTQMEKAILPVVSALKDTIDFDIRYTHFTLHGEKEDTENFRQMCIREEQGDKFLPYIQCITNSTDPSNPADVNKCMKDLKINTAKVDTCLETKAEEYFAADSALSQKYGVQGSPTLVINGVQAESARSPAAVLATICSAFNEAPSECDTELPTAAASPGFGYNTANSAESAAVNCGF